jgi:hypothetical protein
MHHTTANTHSTSINTQVRTQIMIKKITHTHLLQHKHHQIQLSSEQDWYVLEIQDQTGSQIAVHTQTKNLTQQSYAEQMLSHISPPLFLAAA